MGAFLILQQIIPSVELALAVFQCVLTITSLIGEPPHADIYSDQH